MTMVTVTDIFLLADDSPDSGLITLRPQAPAPNAEPERIVTAAGVPIKLDPSGAFSAEVVASDDPGWELDADTVAAGGMPYLITISTVGLYRQSLAYIPSPGPHLLHDLIALDGPPDVAVIPGPPGPQGEVSVIATVTGLPGSDATVVDFDPRPTHAALMFTIPRGDKGDKGDKGDQGTQGEVSVVATNTLPPGSMATVTDSNPDPGQAALTFGIPKGDTGDQGPPGGPVPVGGASGALLRKTSSADGAVGWSGVIVDATNNLAVPGRATLGLAPNAVNGVPRLARTPNAITGDLGLPAYAGSDTGWRDVAALIPAGLFGSVAVARIRRIGSVVSFVLRATVTGGSLSGTAGTTILTIPTGFLPSDYSQYGTFSVGSVPVLLSNTASQPLLALSRATATNIPDGSALMAVTWITSEAWPAGLPGTMITPPAAWA